MYVRAYFLQLCVPLDENNFFFVWNLCLTKVFFRRRILEERLYHPLSAVLPLETSLPLQGQVRNARPLLGITPAMSGFPPKCRICVVKINCMGSYIGLFLGIAARRINIQSSSNAPKTGPGAGQCVLCPNGFTHGLL